MEGSPQPAPQGWYAFGTVRHSGHLNTYDVLNFNLTPTEDGYTYEITRHYGDGSSQKIVVNAVFSQEGEGGQIEVLCDGKKKE